MNFLTPKQTEKVITGIDHLCEGVRNEYLRSVAAGNRLQSYETSCVYEFLDMPNIRVTVTATIEDNNKKG
jgi:hypothetical protein